MYHTPEKKQQLFLFIFIFFEIFFTKKLDTPLPIFEKIKDSFFEIEVGGVYFQSHHILFLII